MGTLYGTLSARVSIVSGRVCASVLIIVEGDPLADIALLQDRGRLLAIMKDGVFHKAPRPQP